MKHAGIVAVIALCSACSSDPEIQPVPPSEAATSSGGQQGNQSGTRLRRIDRVGADGSREFAGWYDSERDEDCDLTTVSSNEGPIRKCLPIPGSISESGSYVDSACSIPVRTRPGSTQTSRGGNPLRDYVLYGSYQSGVWNPHIYVYGAAYIEASADRPVSVQLYESIEPGCVESRVKEATSDLWRLNEVSFDEFVTWAEQVDGL